MSSRGPLLLLGATGQIGHELLRELTGLGSIAAPTRAELDLGSPAATRAFLRHLRPAIVINAAAYTAVDRAEEDRAECAVLNTALPEMLSEECRTLNALLVSFSTDYVFDGEKRTPYTETDDPHPLGVYGRTKLDGERAVAASGCAYLMLRTSWIYSARGKNFPLTILRLARERSELAVVEDQVGAPTSAPAVAAGVTQILRILMREPDLVEAGAQVSGVYHMTAMGSTTWYEFARTILTDDPRSAEQTVRSVRAISTSEYPTAAPRPAYSVLDNSKLNEQFGVRLPSWRDQWRSVLERMRLSSSSASVRGTGERHGDHSTA